MATISPFITIILCFQKFRYHMGITYYSSIFDKTVILYASYNIFQNIQYKI